MISGGGFLDIFKKIIKPLTAVGAVAAAPFTAGTSLSWLPAALAGGSVASGELPGGGGGGGPPIIPGGGGGGGGPPSPPPGGGGFIG